MEHDTAFVVGLVAVAAAGSFDLFDHPVVALGAGVCDSVFKEREQRGPPAIDRGCQMGGPSVPGAKVIQAFDQFGSLPDDATGFVLIYARAPGSFERVGLQRGVLVDRGDPGVSNLGGHCGSVSETSDMRAAGLPVLRQCFAALAGVSGSSHSSLSR